VVREVKEHAVRRSELLEAAQRLVFTKGYEQMTIQDILDELGIAKGTFYHYFKSKRALLEAMIDSLLDDALDLMRPIVDDPGLSAIDKFQQIFDAISGWKTASKEYHLSLLRVWYAEDNAVARWKVRMARIERMRPFIAAVIHQGVDEHMMNVRDPDQTSEVVLSLLQEFIDALAMRFLVIQSQGGNLASVVATVAAYTDALERVVGVRLGSLAPVKSEVLAEWVDAATT
jgi:AcrR family transcriptional regulator